MPVISMAIARHHLRDPDDDDHYLEILVAAAEDRAMSYLNRRVFSDADAIAVAENANEAGDSPMVMNAAVKAACLLILGHLYTNREDVVLRETATKLPQGAEALLTPYRVGWGV